MKRIISILICLCLMVAVSGCGISNDKFITAVENYQIFTDNNTDGLKNVADFIEKAEDIDGEDNKVIAFVEAFWSNEKIKEDNSLIQKLEQSGSFVYDKDKYYGELSVHADFASSKDYSTIEETKYCYLFSLDKNGKVTPEAAAVCYGSGYNYEIVSTKSSDIALEMEACLLTMEVAKSMYAG